ncbi:protein artemis isoform X2 [Anabrus simplex]|uniref:protein artemis isoform X2 n=1 Tax=Anabrus simplex TaxID=316456 RepID=UPI0035A26A05
MPNKTIHFLTHCHKKQMNGLTSKWKKRIYTSPFNVWFLETRIKVCKKYLMELDLWCPYQLQCPKSKETFTVILMDSHHCPGSVMFLFSGGSFGNILYTGDMRFQPQMLKHPGLEKVVRDKGLNIVYLDNTYAADLCVFPRREEALDNVIRLIRDHPNCHIVIALQDLGKEEVLRAIAKEFSEKIYISAERLEILQKLQYEDMFTTAVDNCRIYSTNVSCFPAMLKEKKSKFRTIGIVLTALYTTLEDDVFVVPYSNHSSSTELKEFLSYLRPDKIRPIVPKSVWTGRSEFLEEIYCYSRIPEHFYDLCRKEEQADDPSQTKLLPCPDTYCHRKKQDVRKLYTNVGVIGHRKLKEYPVLLERAWTVTRGSYSDNSKERKLDAVSGSTEDKQTTDAAGVDDPAIAKTTETVIDLRSPDKDIFSSDVSLVTEMSDSETSDIIESSFVWEQGSSVLCQSARRKDNVPSTSGEHVMAKATLDGTNKSTYLNGVHRANERTEVSESLKCSEVRGRTCNNELNYINISASSACATTDRANINGECGTSRGVLTMCEQRLNVVSEQKAESKTYMSSEADVNSSLKNRARKLGTFSQPPRLRPTRAERIKASRYQPVISSSQKQV